VAVPSICPQAIGYDESEDSVEEEEQEENDDDNDDEFQKEDPMSAGLTCRGYQLKPCVNPFGPPNVKLTISQPRYPVSSEICCCICTL
jgi:hypothetical protein